MKATAKAQLKSLRVGPRKVRLLVDLIRGMQVDDALAQLQFSKKSVALPLKKLLDSAIANAEQQNLKREGLVVETAFVDEGKTLKRWMPRAMGRATPIRKRSSHITLVLAGVVDEVAAAKKLAESDKKESDVKEAEVVEEKTAAKKKAAPKKTKKASKAEDLPKGHPPTGKKESK